MQSPDTDNAAAESRAVVAKKPYQRPVVTSHRVFEVSLACVKVPGSPMCQFNHQRNKS